jgi:hypothetical protein
MDRDRDYRATQFVYRVLCNSKSSKRLFPTRIEQEEAEVAESDAFHHLFFSVHSATSC